LSNVEMSNYESAFLDDLMEIDEKMVLSMVKEQLNHSKIRKVNDGKCKNSFASWKVHVSQFFMFFLPLNKLYKLLGHKLKQKRYSTL